MKGERNWGVYGKVSGLDLGLGNQSQGRHPSAEPHILLKITPSQILAINPALVFLNTLGENIYQIEMDRQSILSDRNMMTVIEQRRSSSFIYSCYRRALFQICCSTTHSYHIPRTQTELV